MGKDKHAGPAKTNVARLLDKAGIGYELIPYEVDESNLAAEHVAAQLGEDIRRVSRLLCCRGSTPAEIPLAPMRRVILCALYRAMPRST